MRETQVTEVLGRYLEPGGEGGLDQYNGQCEQALVLGVSSRPVFIELSCPGMSHLLSRG